MVKWVARSLGWSVGWLVHVSLFIGKVCSSVQLVNPITCRKGLSGSLLHDVGEFIDDMMDYVLGDLRCVCVLIRVEGDIFASPTVNLGE